MVGHLVKALSTMLFNAIDLAPRREALQVITILQSESLTRSEMASALKPPKMIE